MRKRKRPSNESLNPWSYHSSGVDMLTTSSTMPSVSTIAPRNTCGVSISNPPKNVINRARNATIFQYIVLPPIKFWFSSLLKMKNMRKNKERHISDALVYCSLHVYFREIIPYQFMGISPDWYYWDNTWCWFRAFLWRYRRYRRACH